MVVNSLWVLINPSESKMASTGHTIIGVLLIFLGKLHIKKLAHFFITIFFQIFLYEKRIKKFFNSKQ